MSSKEIASISPRYTNLKAYYRFESGALPTDSSGEGHTLSVVNSAKVKALVVGGGAGGGNGWAGGGGGAGGYQYNDSFGVTKQAYSIVVGAAVNKATSGNASSFSTITGNGGGKGASYSGNGTNGGCGGGGSGTGTPPKTGGTGDQGGNGGNGGGGGMGSDTAGGGGGGQANNGAAYSSSNGGAGGNGAVNPITGSTAGQNVSGTYYLCGGGGGGIEKSASTVGDGGYGGGGAGSKSNATATSGTNNTGGGGGGGGGGSATSGGGGGSGIVIISYHTDGSDGVSSSSTGGSVTTSGVWTIHTFTGNDTFDCVLTSPTENASGQFGGAVTCGGNTGYSAADHADFKPTGVFTVGMWFKAGHVAAPQMLFFSSSYNSANYGGVRLYIDASNYIYFQTLRGTGVGTLGTDYQQISSSVTVTDGNWHFLVANWDGSYIRIYLDGYLSCTPGAWSNVIGYGATNYVRVGCGNEAGTDDYFIIGSLDDVFLLNGTALSAEQIMGIYRGYLKINGLTNVSVKTINGLAVASIKTINGQ